MQDKLYLILSVHSSIKSFHNSWHDYYITELGTFPIFQTTELRQAHVMSQKKTHLVIYTVDMYDVIITITTITAGECSAHTAITVSVTNGQLSHCTDTSAVL